MCKLCNKADRASTTTEHYNNIKQVNKTFCDVVEQYVGDYPCKLCLQNYATYRSKHKYDGDLDSHIMKRLQGSYIHSIKNYAKTAHVVSDMEYRFDPEIKANKLIREHKAVTSVQVSKNIRLYTINTTGTMTFKVSISGKATSFKTLEEAEAYRDANQYITPNKLGEKYIVRQARKTKPDNYMVRSKKTKHIKTCDTLAEAIIVRDNYLKGLENETNTI